jgi:UDP-N-acetylmuramyl pentapeptide phosphotransferase/UDP-N-acetylglucosamine-1-phosphate transferase
VVIGFVMVVVWFSIDTLAAGYFVTLMEKYNISQTRPQHVHQRCAPPDLGQLCGRGLAVVLSFAMMAVLAPDPHDLISREIAAGNSPSVQPPPRTRWASSPMPSTGWPKVWRRSKTCAGI